MHRVMFLELNEIIVIGFFAGWFAAVLASELGKPQRSKFAFWLAFFVCFTYL